MADVETDEVPFVERNHAFPFIPLGRAIARAEAVFAAHRRSPVRIRTLAHTWNYSASSSIVSQNLADLQAYGLIEDAGDGSEKLVQLTDLAVLILTEQGVDAKAEWIKEAALKPRLFAEFAPLWSTQPVSTELRVTELMRHGFEREAARAFIRVLDDNIAFAALSAEAMHTPVIDSDGLGHHDDFDLARSVTVREPQAPRRRSDYEKVVQTTSYLPHSAPRATLPLPEGVVALELPTGLSQKSLRAVNAWIAMLMDLAAKP
ncbi:MAG: hypothetical protein ABW275_08605 [Hansschlegelia sp.]